MTHPAKNPVSRWIGCVAGLLLAFGSIFPGNTHASSSQSTGSTSFVVIQNGASIPLQKASDLPKKLAGETIYLADSIPLRARHPKPTPTPKPIPTPKATPAPKPAPMPAQGKVATASAAGLPSSAAKKVTDSAVAPAPINVSKPSGKNVARAGKAKSTPSEDDDLDEYRQVVLIADPIEPVNRSVFWFNHQLYHYAFHPLGRAYKTVLPAPVRTGIYNVFDNLEFPIRFVNDLLQWQPKRAGLETEKFVVNSTAGIAGIFRPSNKVPWLKDVPKTDTGVTLAKWGVPHGCYIVWPVLGPKSLRDSVGFVGDLAMYPVTWVTYGAVGGLSGATTLAVSGPDAARNTSEKIDTYDTLTRTSIDRYLSVRSAYEQNRKKAEGK